MLGDLTVTVRRKVGRKTLPYLEFWDSKYTEMGACNLELKVQLSPSRGFLGGTRSRQLLTRQGARKEWLKGKMYLGDFNEPSPSEFPVVFPQGIGTTILFRNMVRIRDTGLSDGK